MTESQARKTHPVLLSDSQLLAECDVSRLRRGGPGGQHRNKVETAVRLAHRPSGVVAEANETRSQERNRKHALERLRFQLALNVRSDVIAGDQLESVWNERRVGTRLTAGAQSPSGPLLVAYALNVLEVNDFDLKPSSARLRSTASQLVKFLRSAPMLWTFVNDQRTSRGKTTLN